MWWPIHWSETLVGPCAWLPLCRRLYSPCSPEWNRPVTEQPPKLLSVSQRCRCSLQQDLLLWGRTWRSRAQSPTTWSASSTWRAQWVQPKSWTKKCQTTGYSRYFHWQVVDTSMGKASHHSTYWAAGLQGNCYLFPALWLWDLDALQKVIITLDQFHLRCLRKVMRISAQSQHVRHWGTHHESTAAVGWTCGSDGWLAPPEDGLLLWAGHCCA